MHGETVAEPKYPEPPLAICAEAIELYLYGNIDEHVVELDDRLFPAEDVYIDATPGFDSLFPEAWAAVHLLRSELNRLVLYARDDTKN